MNLTDQLRAMSRDYPGGHEAMAMRLCKSPSTWQKELSRANGYKLGADDAATAIQFAKEVNSPGWREAANAFCMSFGTVMELPVTTGVLRQDVRIEAAMMVKECSDALQALTQALGDERISDNELRVIQRELIEVVTAAQRVQQSAESVHAASKPAHIREVA